MLKAILRNGAIVPLEPLPSAWIDGSQLEISMVNDFEEDIDEWATRMNQLCADSTPEDEERMQAAIDEHRRQAKEQMRRELGLP